MTRASVYLLHFDKPIAHAQHYLGSAVDLPTRLCQHYRGNGARLMEVVRERGISWQLVRTWECNSEREARLLEREFKHRRKNSRGLCPICTLAVSS